MHRRDYIAGLAVLIATPVLARPPKARGAWQTILDGASLNGWTRLGDANWRAEGGAIVADKGGISFLVSTQDYADFELRAEVWVSDEANSGVFIRCADAKTITAANGYEVNIFDTRPDQSYATGAIVNVAKVTDRPKAGGRWNLMEITAKGDRFWVSFNGQRTVDGARDAAHASGRLALQYGAGVVKFRKVQVRKL